MPETAIETLDSKKIWGCLYLRDAVSCAAVALIPAPQTYMTKASSCCEASVIFASRLTALKADGHGIERKRAEQVTAHALLDLDERVGGRVDPIDAEALGEAG